MAEQNTASDGGLGDFLRQEMGAEFDAFVSSRGKTAPTAAAPSAQTNRFAQDQMQQAEVSAPPTGRAGVATGEQETTTTRQTPTGTETTTDTTQQAGLRLPSPSAQANMLGLDTQDAKDRRETVVQGLHDQGMLDAKMAESILGFPLGQKVTARGLGLIQEPELEAPTVLGGIKEVGKSLFEGAKNLFSGDVVGEAVASGLLRDIKAPKLREEQQKLQQKLLEKHPEQAELINSLKDPAELIQFPDAAELIADSGLVLLDVLTLGKGKAVAAGAKEAAKQALKKGGKKGLATFLKQQLPAMLKTVGKEVRSGAGLGAGFGGLTEIKEGAGFGEALGGAAAGAVIGGAIPLAGKIGGGIIEKVVGGKRGQKIAEKTLPKATSKQKELALLEKRFKDPTGVQKWFGGKRQIIPTDKSIADGELIGKIIKKPKLKNAQEFVVQLDEAGSKIAKEVRPQLKKVKLTDKITDKTLSVGAEIEKEILGNKKVFEDLTSADKKAFSKFQDAFTGAKNADDLWSARQEWDRFTKSNVKQAGELSDSVLQRRKDIWLENRRKINNLIDELAGENVGFKEELNKMRALSDAKQNIATNANEFAKIKGIIPGWLKRTAVTGAAGAAGISAFN